jgi:GGDEF domain-containing protein
MTSAPQATGSERANGSGRAAEVAAMVSLCGQTLAMVSDDITRSTGELERIASDLSSLWVGGTAPTSQQLATPIQALCTEVEQQKRAIAGIADTLQKVLNWPDPLGPFLRANAAGTVSRLPGRVEAEMALDAVKRIGRPSLIGLFYVERLGLVNERFGSAAGDAVVSDLVSRIAQFLASGESLYRWAGAGFVGLFQRDSDSVSALRHEVDHNVPARFEKTIELSTRTALIKVSCKWELFVLAPGDEITEMVSGIDAVFAGWLAGRAWRTLHSLIRA